MVTIKDVAAEARVAISTVSKVLNGYAGVSPATREKVNNAVLKLGFTPNAIASALSSKRSGRIALMLKMRIGNTGMDEINMRYISGAIGEAMNMRLDVVTIFHEMIEDMDVDSLITYLRSQSIEGVIIYGLDREDEVLHQLIGSEAFKVVVVDAPIHNPHTSSVSIDYESAQYDVIMRTLENIEGDRILYIAGKQSSYSTGLKLRALDRLDAELESPATIVYGDFSELRARELTFDHARECDIIACGSDLMAIGAMRALMEMDIFKPVCGFGGIMLMAYAGKQMNTVRQDFESLSRESIRRMHDLLDGGEGSAFTIDYSLIRMKYQDVL